MRRLNFLIASGPTQEPLDPVRYLTNRSSGVMGRRLAQAARARGHRVDFVECPAAARTARDLLVTLRKKLSKSRVLVMAAAVCDVRPASVSGTKIKKERMTALRLVRNPDIAAELAGLKKPSQVFVGFALESSRIFENAAKKLRAKGLDLVLLQKVSADKHPFGDVPIEAFVMDGAGVRKHFGSADKRRIAA